MAYSDHEEASNSTAGEDLVDPAAAFPVLSGPSDANLMEAVNIALAHQDQMEADKAAAAAASPVIVRTSRARGSISHVSRGGISPRESLCGTPDDRSLSSRPATPTTPGESGFEWAPIKTESWEKFEKEAQQVTQGIAGKTIDHAASVMNLLCDNVEKQIKEQIKTLLAARNSEEFRQPGQMENLMGRARYLWECNEKLTKKIAICETQRQELDSQRAQAADERQQLREQIRKLTEGKERLQQQLEDAQIPPSLVAPNSRETAPQKPGDVETRASEMMQDSRRTEEERNALWKQMLELQAVNAELTEHLDQAKLATDLCLPCIRAPSVTLATLDGPMLALVTSVRKRPIRYPQLSTPRLLTIPRNPLPSALDTPTSQLTPISSTPCGRLPLGPPWRGITTFPPSVPQASASIAAPPRQEPDQEEKMDSEPQPGPESQQ